MRQTEKWNAEEAARAEKRFRRDCADVEKVLEQAKTGLPRRTVRNLLHWGDWRIGEVMRALAAEGRVVMTTEKQCRITMWCLPHQLEAALAAQAKGIKERERARKVKYEVSGGRSASRKANAVLWQKSGKFSQKVVSAAKSKPVMTEAPASVWDLARGAA